MFVCVRCEGRDDCFAYLCVPVVFRGCHCGEGRCGLMLMLCILFRARRQISTFTPKQRSVHHYSLDGFNGLYSMPDLCYRLACPGWADEQYMLLCSPPISDI